MVASMLVAAAGTSFASDNFPDVPDDHPFHTEISWAADEGITEGYADGTFRPGFTMTRQAVAAFLYRYAGSPQGDYSTDFDDVDSDHPFYDEIAWAHSEGIVEGYAEDNTFRPGRVATRQAWASFLAKFHFDSDVPENEFSNDFSDVDSDHPFYDEISWMAENGITEGYQDGEFKPGRVVTRQASAAFVYRHNNLEPEPEPGNQDFDVMPADATTSEEGTVRQYEATGINADQVDIALVSCDDVTNDGGTVSFDGTNPGGTGNVYDADNYGSAATISVVNGTTASGTGYENDADSADGDVTFTVNNNAADECYIPVVYNDADDDNNIDLDTNSEPTEAFGIGGSTTVIGPEAADFATFDDTVASVNLEDDYFQLATGESSTLQTYYYDSNDEFILTDTSTNTELTMSEFEDRLSVGDNIQGTYREDPADQSLFNLTDSAPTAPGSVTAGEPSAANDNEGESGIEVTFDEATPETVEEYELYRAEANQPTVTGDVVECPDADSGDYSQIATLPDDDPASGEFVYLDQGVEQPAQGSDPADPQYCYYVVSVDETGDESVPSTIAGPQAAFAGDTAEEPVFTEEATHGANVIIVNYDEAIETGTVDSDGSNYDVESTDDGGVTTNHDVVGATATDDTTVEITVGSTLDAADDVVVSAVTGNDGDTVVDVDDDLEQPVGDAVLVTSTDFTEPTGTTVDDPASAVTVNADTYDIAGSAEDGSTVTVYDNSDDSEVASTTAVGGTYTATADLEQGVANDFYVTATDALGNESGQVDVPIITEDSTAPTFTTGPTATGGTNSGELDVAGVVDEDADDTVEITATNQADGNDVVTATAPVDTSGNFDTTLTGTTAGATYDVDVVAEDAAGNSTTGTTSGTATA